MRCFSHPGVQCLEGKEKRFAGKMLLTLILPARILYHLMNVSLSQACMYENVYHLWRTYFIKNMAILQGSYFVLLQKLQFIPINYRSLQLISTVDCTGGGLASVLSKHYSCIIISCGKKYLRWNLGKVLVLDHYIYGIDLITIHLSLVVVYQWSYLIGTLKESINPSCVGIVTFL